MAFFRFLPELDPVSGLLTLQRELERAFQHPAGGAGPSGSGVFPAVNVFSDPAGYVLKVEVPGIAPDQLTVEGRGRTLTISGKRDAQVPQSTGAFHRRERGAGQFSRSLQLPEDLDVIRAEASCKQGVLTVRIPKKEDAKPRQISIKAA
jgi:HSP20 family protein